MKKIILRTSIITVLSIIFAILILVGGTTLIAPRVMGDIYYDVGFYTLSARCSEVSYKRTGSFSDLKDVVERSCYSEPMNKKLVSKYVPSYISNKNFEEYDEYITIENNLPYSYYNEISCKYIESIYKFGDKSIIEKASSYIPNAESYTNHNALEQVLNLAYKKNDEAVLNELLIKLNGILIENDSKQGELTQEEKEVEQRLNKDIENIKSILNK